MHKRPVLRVCCWCYHSKITIFAIQMRALATIWIVFILCLTASPSISFLFTSKTCTADCCEKTKSTDDCPNNKDCGMTVCNPFMVCCNCNAVVSQNQIISAPYSHTIEKHFSQPAKNGYDFTAEAWNPPRTI